MNDQELIKRYRHLLTPKELQVCEPYARGISQRTIALNLHISRSSVQSRLETATRRLHTAIAQEEPTA